MTATNLTKDSELQELVERVSLEFFGKPFNHKASYNNRLQTTGGRYHLHSHNLDFNRKILDLYGETELVKVIKHELCHYHLHIEGRGYQHRDRDFKQLLAKTGGSRFAPPLRLAKPIDFPQVYCCQGCGKVFRRQRKINLKKYGCPCGGRLSHIQDLRNNKKTTN